MTQPESTPANLWKSVFLLYILSLGTSLSYNTSPNPTLSCRTSRDSIYNGTILDCSRCGLSSDDILRLDFPKTISLILSYNPIGVLQNNSFSQFRGLKKLECVFCSLELLHLDALQGLQNLEFLQLSSNRLKIIDYAFPLGFFRHVSRLKTLKIESNGNEGYASNYSQFIDIFDSLRGLVHLAIDSFGNLRIGTEFTRLLNLDTLTVMCRNIEVILDDSLEGFQNSNVRHFVLSHCHLYDSQIGHMVFQYLPNVSSLTITRMQLGNLNTLKMMKPLRGKRIDGLYFDCTRLRHSSSLLKKIHDSIITVESTLYLLDICLAEFEWTNNHVFVVDPDAFTSGRWKICLKSFTFAPGQDYLMTSNMYYMIRLQQLKELERFVITQTLKKIEGDFWTQSRPATNEEMERMIPFKDKNRMSEFRDKSLVMRRGKRQVSCRQSTARLYEKTIKEYIYNNCECNKPCSNDTSLKSTNNISVHKLNSMCDFKITDGLKNVRISRSGKITILFHNLRTLVFDNVGSIYVNVEILFEKNNLHSLYIRNNHGGGVHLYKRWLGLANLTTIDLTNTSVKGSPTFFKAFPSLRRLILRNVLQSPGFFSQITEKVYTLDYYDIGSNHLLWLPVKMFHFNDKLKYLCLASNRFSGIPFDLKLTPNLEILDMRGNFLVELTSQERQAIDDHIRRVPNTTFLLSNNPFSCTCSALPFLNWLQNSKATFDQDGNYTCMSEDGTFTFTVFYADIASFWRKCQGRSYFLISLILASTLVTFYLAVFLGMKHRTHILSKVRQIVVPRFRLKTRQDCTYDVCIAYADQDGEYVRNVLLRYLENSWHLRTFVHQRDLLQDPLLMSQALRDSWRNVLLITENFLNHCQMAHNVMKVATFFVNPLNPRSVVVMVEERIQHQIPDYVLQVVDEDNIIVLPRLEGFLDYEAKEALKTRLLPIK